MASGFFPFLMTQLALGLFLALESVFAERESHQKTQRVIFHFALSAFNIAVFELILGSTVLQALSWATAGNYGLLSYWKVGSFSQVVLSVLVLDFSGYWMHRWNHTVSFFWKFHQVHHQDREVDATTSLREHIGQRVVSFPLELLTLTVLGTTWPIYLGFKIASAILSFFHHSNLAVPAFWEKILNRFLVTPHFHLVHHREGANLMHFGSIFPWWDQLFGSFTLQDLSDRPLGNAKGSQNSLNWRTAIWVTSLIAVFASSVSQAGSCSSAVPLMVSEENYFLSRFGIAGLAIMAMVILFFFSQKKDSTQ